MRKMRKTGESFLGSIIFYIILFIVSVAVFALVFLIFDRLGIA